MKYAYWLSSIPGLGHSRIHFILEHVSCAQELYELPLSQLKKIEGLTEEEVKNIHKHRMHWDLDKEWLSLMEQGIGFVSVEQPEFPKKLSVIPNAPYALYYIGSLPEEGQRTVGIVGARGCSAYGSQMAERLAQALSDHGVQVISGMAKGIDAEAHRGALKGHSDTYAVLGCGVDVCYPASNRYLYQKIMAQGGILSEYPPGTQPIPWQFPARNRIIAGLSDCVVVVEAKEKSGSLITADFAMEQGKDVFALPGRVTDSLSQGCNQLIKQGAGIVQSVEDFLRDLDILTENTYVQMDFSKNLLEKDERLVYSVTDFRPVGLGALVEKTNLPITRLMEIIEKLERMGMIKETFTNYYVRTILK